MAIFQFISAFGQFVAVVALSFVLIALLTSLSRFHMLTARTGPETSEDLHPHDAFQLEIVQRLGTAHRMPSPFCVMLVEIGGYEAIVEEHGPETGEQVAEFARTCVREVLRKSDYVSLCDEKTVGAIVDTGLVHAEPIAQRVVTHLRSHTCRCASGFASRLSVSLGAASFPESGERVQVLTERARRALQGATAGGGPGAWQFATRPVDSSLEEERVADQSALIDKLTGVLRSDRLGMAMRKFVARYRKNDEPVSLLYLDIDYLNRYNEHYGKEAGDAVLKGVGEVLQQCVREDDLIGRYGGEEFLILMGCTPDDALVAAQRVIGEIKKTRFAFGQTHLKTSASIGVAGYPDHGRTPQQLFDAAEKALYATKAKGRGRCMMYERSMKSTWRGEERVDVF